MHRCSKALGCCIAVVFCAIFAAGQTSQTTPQPPAQSGSQGSAPHRTPLPLNVDRDPVPSPDPDDAPTASQTGPVAPGSGGPLTRDRSGRYTIQRDAYEVRLNASVLDSGAVSFRISINQPSTSTRMASRSPSSASARRPPRLNRPAHRFVRLHVRQAHRRR